MKDNYSWLDDLMGWYERDGETWQPKNWEMSEDLNVTNVKQTIISQIEIEKLRAEGYGRTSALATIKEWADATEVTYNRLIETELAKIADLTEKLKELEVKDDC